MPPAVGMLCKTLAYQNGIDFNTAILASVYGEGDRSQMIQNVLIRALQRGESPKLASGENLYDWIYVEDVVSALIAACEQGKANKTYYVGHQELQTFEYLVTHTRDIVAPDVPLKFGTLQDKTVTDYTLIDREALYQDTGFVCRADFETSIQNTSKWLIKNGKGINMTKKNKIGENEGVNSSPVFIFMLFPCKEFFRRGCPPELAACEIWKTGSAGYVGKRGGEQQ